MINIQTDTLKNTNYKKMLTLACICLCAMTCYQFLFVNFKYFDFAMGIRAPKLMAMALAALCIGMASIVFQTIIANNIVTPCLLGMNALYMLIHTVLVATFGIGSFIITNKLLAFLCDLAIMGFLATIIYSYLFKKTNFNILYVLLIGTILTTLFSSIQNTIVRAMDPNSYDTLLNTLTASFASADFTILSIAASCACVLFLYFRKYLSYLDVMALGRPIAINLGVDFDKNSQRLLLFVTFYIAIATALVGPISFMGLIASNLTRQIFKTHRHASLLYGCVIVSMLTLIGAQLLIEHVFALSVPVSVFISIGGGIYFLYLILKSTKNGI